MTGGEAVLRPDSDRRDAWTLLVDGTPQSHVDLAEPSYLLFEYVRRLGHVVDLVGQPGAALDVVHLGGGALTLPRYVAATRPGSRQRVVEYDEALTEFVRTELPWDKRARIRVSGADAREWLSRQRPDSVDLLIVDVFAGARTPAHLTSAEFVTAAAGLLRPGGVYAVNVADGPPLSFARRQAATLRSVFPETLLMAEPGLLRGRRFSNLVLVGSAAPLPVAELTRRTAGDPTAARLLEGAAFAEFIGTATPVGDADATASPLPPSGVFGR
ncbi:Methyltransferase domain [Actinoalloteichus sp. GBA129-24]|uniref:Methyltransferase domain n=1 Tax=Actinoalloteichus fjordicus TaxID=1612552 RepID=A0AAC9PQA6_9PSEU|nr:Methyltransferase domain [Actinoalloteichus fjordicus]APU18862.1 Methyltransferase domain [Actinoalloteichus sp. GBA129-24]